MKMNNKWYEGFNEGYTWKLYNRPVTCKVLASVMLFLLWLVLFALHHPPRSAHTSPVFAGEAEEPQAWYDLRPLTCSAHLHLWYTTWAQASLNVTSTLILWRDRFHMIRGLMNHVLLFLLLPPTQLICRTFQKTRTSSGNIWTELAWGLWGLISHLTQHFVKWNMLIPYLVTIDCT